MKSFSILRTNVGLSSNIKVVVDSNYGLFLESIDSVEELSSSKFKKVRFNKDNFYDELIPHFFKGTPIDIAFSIRYAKDSSVSFNDFSQQYDDIYQMGARNISNNKDYDEEYEFLAPLYIFKNNIPTNFIIFRVDGPGLGVMSKESFRQEYLVKMKTVKIFDLTRKSILGEWIDRNFKNNPIFQSKSLDVDFRNLEFTRWYGIDYTSGGHTFKSQFLEETLEKENTLFDFEKLFFEGYQNNSIVHPQILNFSFLFDDTPSTNNSFKKWSVNRYCGFYVDSMKLRSKISPFTMPKIKADVSILDGNILYSNTGDPFVAGFREDIPMWVEFEGEFFKVQKFSEIQQNILTTSTSIIDGQSVSQEIYSDIELIKYRIISNINLSGKENFLNKNQCVVDNQNRIIYTDTSPYIIDGFDEYDVNIIEIGGIYHNVILSDDGYLKIISDYGFNFIDAYKFEYFRNIERNFINLEISSENDPISFSIFGLKFTDIKDFDTQIVDSDYSKFEYEKTSDVTKTDEPKMYTTDLRGSSNPPSINDYIYKNNVEFIPCSSDYTANYETFRIEGNELTDLWRKNSVHCRFGYQNSTSTSDLPYLLNNNSVHENFNRSCDTNSLVPDRKIRNLDFFYTINSGTTSYLYHSLHIEKNHGQQQDTSLRFDLGKYLNISTQSGETYSENYFDYLFDGTQSFLDGSIVEKSNKFSVLNSGDKSTPNSTVFRGLKFKLYNVDSISSENGIINDINLYSDNEFEGYKMSILLSKNTQEVLGTEIVNTTKWGNFITNQSDYGTLSFLTSTSSPPQNISVGDIIEISQFYPYDLISNNGTFSVTNVGTLSATGYGFTTDKPYIQDTSTNSGYYEVKYQWASIKNWENDVQYYSGDYVLYDDVLYTVNSDNLSEDPNENPSNLSEYSVSSMTQSFWNPSHLYSIGDWVYRQGEYYYKANSTGCDFWNGLTSSYNTGDVVISNGRFYRSLRDSVISKPYTKSRKFDISANQLIDWIEDPNFEADSESISMWNVVPIWDETSIYLQGDYTVYDYVLYICSTDSIGEDVPGVSSNWNRVYSVIADTEYFYSPSDNPIIKIGDTYKLCKFNNGLTLSSGITIYINKKWKNILININIDDNTSLNLSNTERDILYNLENSRLTAANFIRQINDLDTKYDFANYTKYVIIDDEGNYKGYDISNISNIPYMLICEPPDEFSINLNSLEYKSSQINKNIIKPLKSLQNGEIDNLDKLDFYSDIPIGYEIISKRENEKEFVNYSGMQEKEFTGDLFYRHSGEYMPVFYTVSLFSGNENSKFDDTLTFFGIQKQRVISKINRKDTLLKLKNNSNQKSIYPMLDEFGYTYCDFFIFKSTWDYEYHTEYYNPVENSILQISKPKKLMKDSFIQKFNSK